MKRSIFRTVVILCGTIGITSLGSQAWAWDSTPVNASGEALSNGTGITIGTVSAYPTGGVIADLKLSSYPPEISGKQCSQTPEVFINGENGKNLLAVALMARVLNHPVKQVPFQVIPD